MFNVLLIASILVLAIFIPSSILIYNEGSKSDTGVMLEVFTLSCEIIQKTALATKDLMTLEENEKGRVLMLEEKLREKEEHFKEASEADRITIQNFTDEKKELEKNLQELEGEFMKVKGAAEARKGKFF